MKAVLLNLRVARASDFTNEVGGKKYGCMYFQQNYDGSFCNQPFFFHENTNMEVFRPLYQSRQIWVLAHFFDKVVITEKVIRKKHKKKPKHKNNRPCTCKNRNKL